VNGMIVYGHRSFDLEPQKFLTDLHARIASAGECPAHATLLEWLVDAGEAESAAADALFPDADREDDALSGWAEIAESISAAVCASWYGDAAAIPTAIDRARIGVERVLSGPLPPVLRARTAEGFACYSLYPEQYISAAEEFLAHGRPQAVFCLGLRSIGAILAHVVGATLERAGVRPVVRSARPRGHPFDRRLCVERSLEHLVESSGCDLFAIIDEGPGLSGSSFASAADWLLALGIDRDRIVLVPAWDADADRLTSERGRQAWRTYRRFLGRYDGFQNYRGRDDMSAGRWRPRVCGTGVGQWPAVQPQHERPKFLDSASGRIARFAGIGKTSARRRSRADVLYDAGFGQRPIEIRDGALELEWVDGSPVRTISPQFLQRAAEYLAFIKVHFSMSTQDDTDGLASMIETNAAEAGLSVDIAGLRARCSAAASERVAIDGRMLPHEWIETASGFVKTDALDHHDDDFYPGCRDSAWDVAGVCIECDLDAAAANAFVDQYRRTSGDADIERRLPFYEAAYAAYRLGYTHLAARTVSDETEASRFKRLEATYADHLRRFQRSA
jgi:hypothetical protein